MAGSVNRARRILDGIRPFTAKGVLLTADREVVASKISKAAKLVGTETTLSLIEEMPAIYSLQIAEIAKCVVETSRNMVPA